MAVLKAVLLDNHPGALFYSRGALQTANTRVDHFVAWAHYPVELGENLVRADNRCDSRKRDRLPAWTEKKAPFGEADWKGLEERGILSQLSIPNRVAQRAYGPK